MATPKHYIDKELSWLTFNERVLQEAEDPNVPLIERVRFLGIFSNNLDEFFRVRVADVRRLATYSTISEKEKYMQLLVDIRRAVKKVQKRFDAVNLQLMDALADRNIFLINEKQLQPNQASYVTRYFRQEVLPELTPYLISDTSEPPQIDDYAIYLGVKIQQEQGARYAIVNVPTDRLSRFVRIPTVKGKRKKILIVLENIIRHCLAEVFRGTIPMTGVEAYAFKLTRDAELELGEGITQSLMDKVASSLKRRRQADPVRFLYDEKMPADLLETLSRRLGVTSTDSLDAGGRYHNSKDFIGFPNLGPPYLENKPLLPLTLKQVETTNTNLLDTIRQKDVLLNYPYHSFRYVEDLLHSAAIDPAVRSIKISLYRVAKQSRIATALINAAKNGKEVTAIVELQARFDEEANLVWSQRLTEAGVDVIFGVPGLKVHSKLILIARQESNTLKYYAHIGTGNFNERTALIYTDLSLLTYNQDIANEVAQVFEFIQFNYRRFEFEHLLVSPHSNRSGILKLINNEIKAAKKGKPSGITLKCNNLVDNELIDKLYRASEAGVNIKLIVRGMCSLVPGIAGISENIKAISIVDRFLEHSRIYMFHNNGDPKYLISSADLMTRNLDHRIEVTCPIYDDNAKKHIQNILDMQWADRSKARIIDAQGTNSYRARGNKRKLRSQMAIYDYWKNR